MKIIERIGRYGLILMIGLSFYLTYLIWLSPVNRETAGTSHSKETTQEEVLAKSAADVFLPVRLTRIVKEEWQETNTENFIRKFQKQISGLHFSNVKLQKYESQEAFKNESRFSTGYELAYITPYSLNDYVETFHLNLTLNKSLDKEMLRFLKIQIDDKKQQIRFINPDTLKIVTADILSPLEGFQTLITDVDATWFSVVPDEELLENQYFTDEPIRLKMYSYILSTRPYTTFRDSFFTRPEEVRSNSSSADLYLYDGLETMTIRENQQQVNFQGQLRSTKSFDIFSESYDYIKRLGTSYGSLKYFDQSSNQINYRIFVEGFPVFSRTGEARILLQFLENNQPRQKTVVITGNLTTIQVPIPSEQEIQLPASRDVLIDLIDSGIKKEDLKGIMMGYEWKSLGDSGVVDLYPQWYVHYANQWYSLAELNQELEEKGEVDGL